ncbi:MAG TPA: energy-coupling factor transporter transmembrane component T [Candidatus Limnocylindrales bacterium]
MSVPRVLSDRDDRSPALAPRAWLIWSIAAVTIALLTNNPVYRVLVALAAVNVLVAWLPPERNRKPLALGLAAAAILAALVNVLASHTGADVLFRLPVWVPLAGGPITLESLAYGGAMGMGLVAALLAVAPLSLVLEPHDVVDAMPNALERTGIAVATSMNLVSGIGRTFVSVRDAQQMRGWRPRGLRSWNEVLVPVVLTAIEDSVLLAEAMEARGFGAGRRTSYSMSSWTRWDAVVALSALAGALLFIGARVAGVAVDWYPYPTLALPPIQPLLVLGCLALALPAFRRD